MTSAVITNTSLQLTNVTLSNGKVKFDVSSLTKSAMSAGIGAYASSYINGIDTLANGGIKSDYFNFSYADMASSATSAAVQSGVYGSNFKDAFISNLAFKATDSIYNAVGSYSANELQLNNNQFFNEGGLGKIALHSAVGALSASITNQDILSGAISAGVNEAMSSILYQDTSNMTQSQKQEYNDKRLLYSQLTGIAIGALINGEAGANTGYNITTSAELNNRQLHQDEIDFISSKADEYAKTHNISKEQATKILYTAAKTLVDENANTNFNSNENFIATDELGNSVTYNLNEIANGYNKDDISKAKEFLKSNSNNLKFTDIYKEEFNKQTFFTATKEQYENSNWTPDRSIGLSIDIPSLLPTAGVAKFGMDKTKSILYNLEKPLKFSNTDKITRQMQKRGWTETEIREAMQTKGIPTIGKNGAATRFIHPKTGKSVVVDDKTGEIFHVGDIGFKYDY